MMDDNPKTMNQITTAADFLELLKRVAKASIKRPGDVIRTRLPRGILCIEWTQEGYATVEFFGHRTAPRLIGLLMQDGKLVRKVPWMVSTKRALYEPSGPNAITEGIGSRRKIANE
jgi:hypothetical protein